MALVDALLPEFDREAGTTRRLLERVPADAFAWSPHPRSMPMGELAGHLAGVVGWAAATLTSDAFDLSTAPRPAAPADPGALLAGFDAAVAEARAALAGRTDGELLAPWSLLQDGALLFTMPKAGVLRTFVLNHLVHHRGQLSVYLRLRDVPVPSIYGPSADERPA